MSASPPVGPPVMSDTPPTRPPAEAEGKRQERPLLVWWLIGRVTLARKRSAHPSNLPGRLSRRLECRPVRRCRRLHGFGWGALADQQQPLATAAIRPALPHPPVMSATPPVAAPRTSARPPVGAPRMSESPPVSPPMMSFRPPVSPPIRSEILPPGAVAVGPSDAPPAPPAGVHKWVER